MDDFALLLIGLLTLATAGVVVLSYLYLRDHETRPLEYYTLLLIANFGGATLVAATHFASFFLGLEILSVSLYALIGYPRLRGDAVEAAVKYLILAAAPAAVLLFGMALIYAQTGSMDFAVLHNPHHPPLGTGAGIFYVAGLALIIVGVGFKLALVPFHMWTPDVYQGAPAPVTAFVATVSKGAMVAILLRFFRGADYALPHAISIAFTVIAIASMIAGNLLAARRPLPWFSTSSLTSSPCWAPSGSSGCSRKAATRRRTSRTTVASPPAAPGWPARSPPSCSHSPASRSRPASSASSIWSPPAPGRRSGCC